MEQHVLRADMHVHSKYSKRPSEWFLRKIGCSESYTEPLKLYALAKKRGMDLVTITDHNTIGGSLEIAHLKGAFVSEEITTYFPEDGCKLHVLAYDITESQHEDITRVRESVYDLVAYLHQEQIIHVLAHPMFSINDRLTLKYFEQLLLLFNNFELNGTRDNYQNTILKNILINLTKQDIDRLTEKHHREPYGSHPWQKNMTGGSDDHSSVNIARTYTEVDGVSSVEEFLKGITQNKATVHSKESNPKTFAHTVYSIAYQFYKTKFNFGRHVNKDILLRFADRALIPVLEEEDGFMDYLRSLLGYRRPGNLFRSNSKTMQGRLQKEARKIIFGDPHIKEYLTKDTLSPQEMADVWFRFVNTVSDKVLRQFADSMLENFSGANLFDIFHTIGSVGSLYTTLAPYFISYRLFTKDRQFCHQCYEHFCPDTSALSNRQPNIAHFTDTFYDVNGVAKTLQRQVEMSRKNNQALSVITCGAESETTPGLINFSHIGTFEMPEYPSLTLYYPPLLKMLDYCYEQNFTIIHSATPGPLGLAALAIARILKLPFYGTYHTALPQYVSQLTEDFALEEAMWRYVVWYYNQMDRVYVPSYATGNELIEKGIDKKKIVFYARGIDTEHFHPSKRNGFFDKHFGIDDNILKLLYVGRISKEKNLHILAKAFQKLTALRQNVHLVIVGDGPYLLNMRNLLENMPVTFTGFLSGEELAQAYASSDIFVFPSTTDTFGNVVLEAQASGIPVVVTDAGGPQENVVPHKTGIIVPADNSDAILDAIVQLAEEPGLLQSMKYHARKYTEQRSLEAAYEKLWQSYQM